MNVVVVVIGFCLSFFLFFFLSLLLLVERKAIPALNKLAYNSFRLSQTKENNIVASGVLYFSQNLLGLLKLGRIKSSLSCLKKESLYFDFAKTSKQQSKARGGVL